MWLKLRRQLAAFKQSALLRVLPPAMGGLLMFQAGREGWGARRNPFLGMVLQVAGVLFLFAALRLAIHEFWTRYGPVQYRNRWRVRVPFEAVVYSGILLMLLLGSLSGRSNTLMLVFGWMAGPFVLNGWVNYHVLRGTRVSRQLPTEATAGEAFSVSIQVANGKRWLSSWMVLVRDRIENGVESLPATVLVSRVKPRKTELRSYRVQLEHRGLYRFGPLEASSRFPLGLTERSMSRTETGELLVLPRRGRLTRNWQQDMAAWNSSQTSWRAGPGHFEDEFYRLREYRSGDSPRSIHWPTSARKNALVVREFHQHRRPDVFLLLDVAPVDPLADDPGRIERAISFVATLLFEQTRHADDQHLALGLQGNEVAFWHGRAGLLLTPVLRKLAVLQPGAHQSLDQLLAAVRWEEASDARPVLVTTRDKNVADLIPPQHPFAGRFQILTSDRQSLAPYFVWEGEE